MSKNYMKDSQASEIIKYISDTMKLPLIGAGGGFAPLGMYGFSCDYVLTPPQGWLFADGSIYNIADYPEYAALLASQHGRANIYGGDGVTTFATKDLRGEFIRGWGKNSHKNQGNGANVGKHQDGTHHRQTWVDPNNRFMGVHAESQTGNTDGKDADYRHTQTGVDRVGFIGSTSMVSDEGYFTSRPTNTSVAFLVKVTVSGDANAHQYSTEEQIVGMTEDGEYIYEKTITGLNIRLNWVQQYCADSSEIDPLIQNVGIVYSCNARCNGTTDADVNTTTNLPIILKRMNSNGKWKFRSFDDYIVKEVTIQYTKTTS